MHRALLFVVMIALTGPLLLAGCIGSSTDPPAKGKAPAAKDPEAGIRAMMDKLEPEDRKLAEAQKWCAVETEKRLGEMGKPYKVMVKGQPVFLCCKGCQADALAHEDNTLKTAATLKAKAGGETAP